MAKTFGKLRIVSDVKLSLVPKDIPHDVFGDVSFYFYFVRT